MEANQELLNVTTTSNKTLSYALKEAQKRINEYFHTEQTISTQNIYISQDLLNRFTSATNMISRKLSLLDIEKSICFQLLKQNSNQEPNTFLSDGLAESITREIYPEKTFTNSHEEELKMTTFLKQLIPNYFQTNKLLGTDKLTTALETYQNNPSSENYLQIQRTIIKIALANLTDNFNIHEYLKFINLVYSKYLPIEDYFWLDNLLSMYEEKLLTTSFPYIIDTQLLIMLLSSYRESLYIGPAYPKLIEDIEKAYNQLLTTKKGFHILKINPTTESTSIRLIPSYKPTTYQMITTNDGKITKRPIGINRIPLSSRLHHSNSLKQIKLLPNQQAYVFFSQMSSSNQRKLVIEELAKQLYPTITFNEIQIAETLHYDREYTEDDYRLIAAQTKAEKEWSKLPNAQKRQLLISIALSKKTEEQHIKKVG